MCEVVNARESFKIGDDILTVNGLTPLDAF